MAAQPAQVCPDRAALEAVLAGDPSADAARRHLESCPSCRSAVAQLREENSFLREFAGVVREVGPQPSTVATATLIPGYTIVEELRRGGQGVIYRAIQRSTQREVAIKVMREGPFASRADRGRFEREVQILAQLEHPNIIAIHDSGVAAGSYYFVMDLVRGLPLDEYLERGRRAAEEQALPRAELEARLSLVAKICEAVNAAHLRGVIHRDLKPGNLMVDELGEPRVLDFGLARVATGQTDPAAITRSAHFVGTPQWASPEQVSGEASRLDLRSDVYALGLVLYYVLTGGFPYAVEGSLADVIARIRTAEPEPPGRRRRGIDGELDTLVLKCLSKEPERRYETAGALARDLRRYLAREPLDARRDSAWYVIRKRMRRYRAPLTLAATALAALVVFAVTMSVLYHRATLAEEASRVNAVQLAEQLSLSNIERARALALVGSVPLAEDLLWTELLTRSTAPPGIEFTDPAFWTLIELYARHPCVATAPVTQPEADYAILGFKGDPPLLRMLSRRGPAETWETQPRLRRRPEAIDLRFPSTFLVVGIVASGQQVLVGDPESLDLTFYDLVSGASRRGGLRMAHRHSSPTLSPDGTRFALCDGHGTIGVYGVDELAALSERLRFSPYPGSTEWQACRFSADNATLVAADATGRLAAWDLGDGGATLRWRRTDAACRATGISHDGSLVAFIRRPDQVLSIASMRTGELFASSEQKNLPEAIRLEFDDRGQRLLVVYGNSTEFAVFDARTAALLASLRGSRSTGPQASFSPDGRRIASVGGGVAKMWDVPASSPAAHQSRFSTTVLSVAFDADRALLCAVGDGVVRSVSLAGDAAPLEIAAHVAPAASVAPSPDGQSVLSAGYDGKLHLCDGRDGRLLVTLEVPDARRLFAAAFHPDGGRIAAACDDGRVYVWNARTLERCTLAEHAASVATLTYSPDGRWLASGDRRGELIVRDALTHELVFRRQVHPGTLRKLAFSPDGRTLATGGDDSLVKLWDSARGEPIGQLRGHQQPVFAVAFRGDGKLLASGDQSGTIILWDVASRRNLLQLDRHTAAIFSVAFSPDGRRLASGSSDRTAIVHDLAYLENYVAGNFEAALSRLARLGGAAARERVTAVRGWVEEREATSPGGP